MKANAKSKRNNLQNIWPILSIASISNFAQNRIGESNRTVCICAVLRQKIARVQKSKQVCEVNYDVWTICIQVIYCIDTKDALGVI